MRRTIPFEVFALRASIDILWQRLFEPALRCWPGYPPDWERRRLVVYERAFGRCERCGLPVGRIGLRGTSWRVIRAHIHHVQPISAGGGHALANLQVRCVACHAAEHPDVDSLRRPMNAW